MLHYTKQSKEPIFKQLVAYYKHAIVNNHIKPNTKLPSIRAQAKSLSLSTTTIEKAYQQLLVEGFIESIPKSGYYTVDIPKPLPTKNTYPIKKTSAVIAKNAAQIPDIFDMNRFRKCMNDIYMNAKDLYSPPSAYGELALQEAISDHVFRERGIKTSPPQIVIAAGIQNLITHLSKPFKGEKVAYLTPRFERALSMFELHGFETIPCDNVSDIIKNKPKLIYIAPSNHYPTGDVMPIRDRLALIEYAKDNNAYILEDDYNHIFRYNVYQVPSMYALAKGNYVIYIGTFSRNLLISMRTSYMIVPNILYAKILTSEPLLTQTVSKAEQLALALYMKEGYYNSHLKRLAKWSKKQNETVVDCLKNLKPFSFMTFKGLESNTHILIETTNKKTYDTLRLKAKNHHYEIKTFDTLSTTILLPYSGLTLKEIETMLTQVLCA